MPSTFSHPPRRWSGRRCRSNAEREGYESSGSSASRFALARRLRAGGSSPILHMVCGWASAIDCATSMRPLAGWLVTD